MPRTIIDVPSQQLKEVDDLCKQLGIARAEAVRRGLSEFIQQNTRVARAESFGLWRGQTSAAKVRSALRGKW